MKEKNERKWESKREKNESERQENNKRIVKKVLKQFEREN